MRENPSPSAATQRKSIPVNDLPNTRATYNPQTSAIPSPGTTGFPVPRDKRVHSGISLDHRHWRWQSAHTAREPVARTPIRDPGTNRGYPQTPWT